MIRPRSRNYPASAMVFAAFSRAFVPADTSSRAVEGLQRIAHPMTLRAGETARLATGASHVAYVVEGATKLIAQAAAGREQVLAFYFPGDIVTVSRQGVHAHGLVAMRDTRLVVFDESDFLALAAQESGLMAALLGRVIVSLNRCREKTLLLGRKTAAERIASFLATMVERIGRPHGSGWAMTLPMSRRDIADSLGLTIETVSRQFSELRAAGLIATSGRALVEVLDRTALETRAGFLAPAP